MNMRGVLDDHVGHFHLRMVLCIISLVSNSAVGRRSCSPATQTYTVGSRKMVSSKAAISPPTMTMANGRCESEDRPDKRGVR
jgi:hypothetical protein